jgi:hypothetical protein
LKSSRTEHGLLINFGSYKFQIKKYAMSDRGPSPSGLGFSLLSGLFALSAFFCGYFGYFGTVRRHVSGGDIKMVGGNIKMVSRTLGRSFGVKWETHPTLPSLKRP